jgi:hypothetical protein
MNALNRIILALLGILSIGAGAAGVANSRGWVSNARLNEVVHHDDAWQWWSGIAWTDAHLWALAATSVAVGVLAIALAAAELRPQGGRREARTILLGTSERGRTTLRVKAVRHALERDAGATHGVESGRVLHLTLGEEPVVSMRLRAGSDRELVVAGREVSDRVARTVASMIGRPAKRVDVELDVRPMRAAPQRKVA